MSSTDEKLQLRIENGGGNLSAGQRQLVSLAGTLLRDVRIVILDEATSVLDKKADEQIQSIVREAFANSTVLLISHRFENIIKLDRSMEVANGKVSVHDVATKIALFKVSIRGVGSDLTPPAKEEEHSNA